MFPGTDSSQMGQGRNHADRAMPAHPQVGDIIKEDDCGSRRWIHRLAEQGPHHDVGTPRFEDDAGTKTVMVSSESLKTCLQIAGTQIRTTRDDDACRLPCCMGVHDFDTTECRNRSRHASIVSIYLPASAGIEPELSASQCCHSHFACSGIVSYSVQANFFESGDQPPVLPEPWPPKKVVTVVNSAPFAPTPSLRRSSLIFMPSPM
jgi:hypothetical protein